MAGKAHIYYTFKVLSGNNHRPEDFEFQVAVHKWDELEGSDELPVDTYKVMPNNRTAVGGCSCPAWKWDCKHWKAVNEAIKLGYAGEFHRYKWTERGGWEKLDDLHVDSWEVGK